MSPEQFERWRDFAMRMAKTCFRKHRRPNATWIVAVVEDWFDEFDESDIPCIVNWDHSTAYPAGNPHHGRQSWLSYCGCNGYRPQHGTPNPTCEECHGRGVHYALHRCSSVGDMVSSFLDEYRGYAPSCRACDVYEYRHEECRCEDIGYRYYNQWDEQWGGPVCCCIRAGLDIASAPSGGVVGFTAGDVRRMFPGGVPDWVFPPNERLKYWLSDELNGTFAELPDSAGLVL